MFHLDLRDEPDVTTRLTIYFLYYKDVKIYIVKWR